MRIIKRKVYYIRIFIEQKKQGGGSYESYSINSGEVVCFFIFIIFDSKLSHWHRKLFTGDEWYGSAREKF